MQDLIRKQPGVVSTRVGYTGGDVPNATYRNHGTHAEAIEIVYDPSDTDYRTLLEFFFQIHDPTTKNRQGNDMGTSYRSAIFYLDDEQKRIALDTIADVEASGLWPGKVVTEVSPAGDFWEAEPEHQDYLQHYPNGYTCHYLAPRLEAAARAPQPRSQLSRSAPAHDDPAAVLRGVGDPAAVPSLVRGIGSLDGEVAQHRSKHHVHLHVGERRPDAAAGAAAERDPREGRRLASDEPLRVEALRVGEDVGVAVYLRRCRR